MPPLLMTALFSLLLNVFAPQSTITLPHASRLASVDAAAVAVHEWRR